MKKTIQLAIIIFVVLLLSSSVVANNLNYDNNVQNEEQVLKGFSLHKNLTRNQPRKNDSNIIDSHKRKKDLNKEQEFKEPIKGIYLTGWIAGLPSRFNKLVSLVNNTELNAMVIDIKTVDGEISYNSQISLAKKLGANVNKIRDIRSILQKCKENNIYTIARIPVFKDKKVANESRHALRFYDNDGDQQEILASKVWVNPYSREVWRYNVDLAMEAAMMGFDEIQFDYIRLPVFINLDRYNLAVAPANSKVEIINGFVRYARKRLSKHDMPFSIDVFGLTTSGDDLGIGQDFSSLAAHVDYISPMVYPSHYAPGAYGLRFPEKEPYFTILKSMQDAKKQLGGKGDKLRPWLQDFSLRHVYGVKEVRDQIKAAKALGLESWLLWNPSSRYTWQAFQRNDLAVNGQQVSVITDRNKGDKDVRTDRGKSNAEKNESKKRLADRT